MYIHIHYIHYIHGAHGQCIPLMGAGSVYYISDTARALVCFPR